MAVPFSVPVSRGRRRQESRRSQSAARKPPLPAGGTRSGNDVVDDVAVDVGQAEVAAVVAVGEPFVIQAQEVEDGGVEIVMRDAVLDGVHAEFVGGAVGDATLDAAARHPHGEAVMVVAAAEGCFGQRPVRLLKRRAAELGGPDDESLVQQAA